MKRRFAALGLAAAWAVGLAGCAEAGALRSMEWAIRPTYAFEAVEPVADTSAGMVSARPGEAGYYLAKTAGGWGVLNALTGETAAVGAFEERPGRCHLGHLVSWSAPQWAFEDPEAYQRFNTELEAIGTSYRLEVGHGGRTDRFLADGAGAVTAVSSSESGFYSRPVSEVEGLPGLIPVQKGGIEDTGDGWGRIEVKNGGLCAVASSDGTLLTDFVYQNACMGTDEAIAVCKEGRWGYLNAAGEEIIPCEYEAFWGERQEWDEEAGAYTPVTGIYPAPLTEGCVVVKQGGKTGVRKADGSWLLKMGEVEDAAPAFGGLLWVRTEGKWGAVKLPAAE